MLHVSVITMQQSSVNAESTWPWWSSSSSGVLNTQNNASQLFALTCTVSA